MIARNYAPDDFSAGTGTIGGTTYANCWRVLGSSAHLIYEDGDQGMVPLRDLKPEHGV